MSRILAATPEAIAQAADTVRHGGLVAFPTETVYGLGADACDGRAVARIFEAKGRPAFNPLIIHVENLEQAEHLAVFDDRARTIACAFWPGPLTLVLPRLKDGPVSDLAAAGLPTLAIRVPRHPVALALLRAFAGPIAAPSANRSGSLSPTTPLHVARSLGDSVDLILAGGACAVGVESTVLDLSEATPAILRPGAVTDEDLAMSVGAPVAYATAAAPAQTPPRSPGQLLRHYAPSRPLRLRAVDIAPEEALLAFGSVKFMGIKGGGAVRNLPDTQVRNLSESGDLYEAAANLFAMLHILDRPEHRGIAVMDIPETGLGIAINDRLRRAAESTGTR